MEAGSGPRGEPGPESRGGEQVIRSRRTLLVLAVVGMLASGCGRIYREGDPLGPDSGQLSQNSPYLGTTTSDDQPTPGGRLVYGLPAETNSWNPAVAQWGAYSLEVARALFDTLYAYDADGNAQPNLAAGAEHNEDYTVWTIALRPGIKFHNGRSLTSYDIIQATEFFRSSEVIGGAYHLTAMDHAEVIDDLTYRVYATKPWPTMKDSSTTALAVAADITWLKSTDWAHPIGTGPFKIESWDLNHSIVLSRNRDYWRTDRWGNRLPYLDSIEFRVIPSDQQRANALSSGDLDIMMQTLPTAGLLALRQECREEKLQCFSDEKGETPENYVVLNTSIPPFDDIDARRALALAVDRDDYVRQVTGGLSTPADGVHAPGSPWYTPSVYPAYDPDEARHLAEKVRARQGGDFRFTLMGASSEESTRIMQYLQAAWKKIGIEADIDLAENQQKIIRQLTGDYQASVTQNFDYTRPTVTAAFFDPSQTAPGKPTLVFSRLNDAELGARIETLVRAAPTMEAWRTANTAVMNRLNELVPFIWLDHAPRTIVARPNLVNVVDATLPDGEVAADFTGGAHGLSQIWVRR
jgi:peptide/nickel transport system substrate-binding protein